jgi:hypothetical protein
MKIFFRQTMLLIFTSLAGSLVEAAQPGESLILNPVTGDYALTYCGLGPEGAEETCELRRFIYEPATKIDPSVKSKLSFAPNWVVKYRYSIKNGKKSQQEIESFSFAPVVDIVSSVPLSKLLSEDNPQAINQYLKAGRAALATPAGWRGTAVPSNLTSGLRVAWSPTGDAKGLLPGAMQGEFGFSARELPGLSYVKIKGGIALAGFEDDGPSGDIAKEFQQLRQNNFVKRLAAVPTIPVPFPFDRVELIRRIQAQVKTWVDLKLLDPAAYSSMERYFQAAIAAASRNDMKALEKNIDEIRDSLYREHLDLGKDDDEFDDDKSEKEKKKSSTEKAKLIDKLAARILEFDLLYVRLHP